MRLKIFSTCLLLFAATSCDKMETDTLFCNLTLSASLPDGAAIVRMEVDKSLESTYIRNINNRMEYDFPVFVNNKGTLTSLSVPVSDFVAYKSSGLTVEKYMQGTIDSYKNYFEV